MEMSSNLTLNEEALAKLPESKKALFVFEWLQFLQNVLVAAQKVKLFNYSSPPTHNFNPFLCLQIFHRMI